MYYKVVLKNFKNGVVIRKNIMYYNDTEENIILKCINGETKTYQKNEWVLIRIENGGYLNERISYCTTL